MSKEEKEYKHYISWFKPYLFIMFFTLLIRFAFINHEGYITDINTFKSWSKILVESSLNNFYYSDNFTDYPPLYMYILFIIGKIISFFNIEYTSGLVIILLKLPAIIFDCLTVSLIYKITLNRLGKNRAFVLSLFYGLNPAVFINSAIWGQVDSIYTFIIFLAIYIITVEEFKNNCFINLNYLICFLLFIIGILLKPQSLIFSPIFIFIYISYLFSEENKIKKINTSIFSILACLVFTILICLPFVKDFDFHIILNQYIGTLAQYNYQTLNAYNFYALIGNNFKSIEENLIFNISSIAIGYISVLIFTLFTFYFLIRNRHNKFSLFLASAFITLSTFMFCIKMHERYLFPIILFLLITHIYTNNKKFLILFFGFSFTYYINCFDVIKLSLYDFDYTLLRYGLSYISFFNLILFIYLFITLIKLIREKNYDFILDNIDNKFYIKVSKPIKNVSININKKDIIIISIITFIYSIIAFYNLGNTTNPNTFTKLNNSNRINVSFYEATKVKSISILNGAKNNKSFYLNGVDVNGFNYKEEFLLEDVFKWYNYPIEKSFDNIYITIKSNNTYIQEICFLDENNEIIPIKSFTSTMGLKEEEVNKLFDEQDFFQVESNYKNSTYFDEIYYVRTAFEFIHKLESYETTHPPLGKVFMALSVKKFGTSPFYYRLPSVICGILMIPFMYLFSLKMFKDRGFALFSSVLLMFDFMHYTQTRIATIDSYVTLFVLIMFYFMYLFYEKSFYYYNNKILLKYLFLSGLFMGLAISSKWIGVYGGIGLSIIFFISLYSRFKEHIFEKITNSINITKEFNSKTRKIILFCVLFFVIIPIIIYRLSYCFYLDAPSKDGIKSITDNQVYMLTYHKNLYDNHSFASDFWTWGLIIRPMYYYANTVKEGVSGISAFGNPFIWYVGTVSLFYTFTRLKSDRHGKVVFLLVGYLSGIIPWIFIFRTTYIYHYFTSSMFMILMITNMFIDIFKTLKNKYVIIYIVIVILGFIIFYPVISGIPVSQWYVRFLRWLPTWVLAPQ